MPFKADQAVSKYTLIFRKISKVFELKKQDSVGHLYMHKCPTEPINSAK